MSINYMVFGVIPWVVLMSLIRLAIYILGSIGMYSMANNTGVNDSWLAWVPVAREYLLGSLADRYSASAHRKSYLRAILPILGSVRLPVWSLIWSLGLLIYFATPYNPLVALGVILLVNSCLEIAHKLFYLVSFYHIMMDYEPSRAVAYTILAFFGLGELVLFFTRNNVPTGIAGRNSSHQPKYNVHSTFEQERKF